MLEQPQLTTQPLQHGAPWFHEALAHNDWTASWGMVALLCSLAIIGLLLAPVDKSAKKRKR